MSGYAGTVARWRRTELGFLLLEGRQGRQGDVLDARNEHGLIQIRKREDREHEDEDDGGAGPGGPGRGRRAPHHGEVHLRCREGLAQPASEEGALETLGGEADEKASARRVMKYGEGKWQRLRRGSRPGSDMHSRTKTLANANAWIHSPPDRAHASPSRPPLRQVATPLRSRQAPPRLHMGCSPGSGPVAANHRLHR